MKSGAKFGNIFFALSLCFLFVWPVASQCAISGEVILKPDQNVYSIGLNFEILDDPEGRLSIEQVSSPEFSHEYNPGAQKVPNFGLTSSTHWLRTEIVNQGNDTQEWYLVIKAPVVDYVDLYFKRPGGVFRLKRSGDARPFDDRDIKYRCPAFKLSIGKGERIICYLRVSSSSMIRVDPYIYSDEAFHAMVAQELGLWGTLVGALGVIAIVSVFFWITLWDKLYLFHMLSVLAVGFFLSVFEGWAFRFFWPDSVRWASLAMPVAVGQMYIWSLIFARGFLRSAVFTPTWDKLALAVIGCGIFINIIGFFHYREAIIIGALSSGLWALCTVSLGIGSLIKGHRQALYYLAAHGILWVSAGIGFLELVDIVDIKWYGLTGMQIGLPLTMLILSMGLVDRYRTMQEDHSRNLEDTIAQRTTELRRALTDLEASHDNLENRVIERTQELSNVNDKLRNEINERRTAEGRLEEALFQLEERARECFISEERFRKIFEAAGDCIFIKDRDLRYDQVNPFMLNLLGVSARDVIGKTDVELFGKDSVYHSHSLEQKALKGNFIESEQRLELNGVQYTFSFARFPIEDGSGEILGICGIGRDITDRKKMESDIGNIDSEYKSRSMRETLAQINAAAMGEGAVLALGESGAGKDYWAKYLHDKSKRASGPYWAVNCAALSPELVESELFGHEKGAFTGATRMKRGMLELAEGGTLLLNEIGEMPLRLQSKLLTFLDTKSFNRLGGEDMIFVDSRIVAATNRDLIESVEKGEFRRDLFYRLNVFTITIPPLRDRIEDLPGLAKQLTDEICENMGISVRPTLDEKAVSILMEYNWPGNIRELRNVLERAIILGKGSNVISAHMLNLDEGFTNSALEQEGAISHELKISENNPFHEAFKAARKAVIQEALDTCDGNVSAAARMLGIPRGSLRTQMRSLGMG